MRYFISLFFIVCIIGVLFVGCVDTNADNEATPSSDTTTIAPDTTVLDTTEPYTTSITPETTVLPDSTALITTTSVTTEPAPAETTDPWVVTAPAGDGWSGFH